MVLDVKAVSIAKSLIKRVGNVEKIADICAKSSEKTPSIFQQASSTTANPMLMDAKATLNKLKIKTSVVADSNGLDFNIAKVFTDKIAYREFEGKIRNEISSKNSEIVSKVMNNINPINEANMAQIKEKLEYFTKDLPPELEKELMSCSNPEELFKLIKTKAVEIANHKPNEQFVAITETARTSGITPSIERLYRFADGNATDRFKKLVNIFTTKSTNPEVLKIEEELKQLGIKDVNFADDIEHARLVKEAISDLIDRRMPLPDSITVTPVLPFSYGGATLHKDIYIPTSAEVKTGNEIQGNAISAIKNLDIFKNASSKYQKRLLENLEDLSKNQLSTKNTKHMIYHETAHTFEPKTVESAILELNPEEMNIANEISMYAASHINGQEAMPEMFAKLMDGQKLTDKQMKLYLKLGGIVPQF